MFLLKWTDVVLFYFFVDKLSVQKILFVLYEAVNELIFDGKKVSVNFDDISLCRCRFNIIFQNFY